MTDVSSTRIEVVPVVWTADKGFLACLWLFHFDGMVAVRRASEDLQASQKDGNGARKCVLALFIHDV